VSGSPPSGRLVPSVVVLAALIVSACVALVPNVSPPFGFQTKVVLYYRDIVYASAVLFVCQRASFVAPRGALLCLSVSSMSLAPPLLSHGFCLALQMSSRCLLRGLCLRRARVSVIPPLVKWVVAALFRRPQFLLVAPSCLALLRCLPVHSLRGARADMIQSVPPPSSLGQAALIPGVPQGDLDAVRPTRVIQLTLVNPGLSRKVVQVGK